MDTNELHEYRKECLRNLIEKEYGGTQKNFAEATGIDANYISRILSDSKTREHRNIGNKILARISEVHPDWLDDKTGTAAHGVTGQSKEDPDLYEIPQFDTGGAMGAGLILKDQPGIIKSWRVNKEWLHKNVKGYNSTSSLCIVTGFGDSMRGLFNPGDPLLVDTSVKKVEFDSVYFFRVGDEGFIKRLQRIPGEGLRVLSANRDQYEPWTIKPEMDFEVLGRVLKVWRSEEF